MGGRHRRHGAGAPIAPAAVLAALALVRTWAEGGPFPSQGRTVPTGTPLVVDIRAANLAQQLFEARVAPDRRRPVTAGRRLGRRRPPRGRPRRPSRGRRRSAGPLVRCR